MALITESATYVNFNTSIPKINTIITILFELQPNV